MDLIRSIRKSIVRFVSIVAIVALGISFFVGIKSASPDMRNTANEYFVEDNVLDLTVTSTIGFTADEVHKIARVEGVRSVDPIKLADTLVFVDGKGIVNVENGAAMACRVMSMNFPRAYAFSQSGEAKDSYINRITLVEGRYPQNKNECLIDSAVAGSYSELTIGNTITLAGDGTTLSDTLKTDTFKIVGTVSSPMYLSFERGSTNIGSGTLGMFIYIGEECFVSDYYAQVYATVEGKENYDAFSDEYNDYVAEIGARIEAISQESIRDRLSQVKVEYEKKIADGEKAYTKAEKETTAQLKEALKKINTIDAYISSGDSKIAAAQTTLASKIASAEGELKASKEEYEASRADYNANNDLANNADSEIDGYQKLREMYKNYLDRQQKDRKEIDAFAALLPGLKDDSDKAKAELDNLERQSVTLSDQINKKDRELAENKRSLKAFQDEEANWNPETSTESLETIQSIINDLTGKCNTLQAELDSLNSQYKQVEAEREAAKTKYDNAFASYTSMKATVDSREKTYKNNQDMLNSYADDIAKIEQGEKDLDIFKEKLKEASVQLDDAKIKITESQLKLYYEESKGKNEIAAGLADLKSARIRLASAEEAYSDAEHEARVSLKKARGDIDKAKAALDELNDSAWKISYPKDLPGHESYGQSLENITAMANVFPVFFFLIAAMMCLATMTRMVEEERMQLGTLKALGYKENSILAKYYWYAAIACVIGSAIGVVIGAVVFPKAINSAYAMMYCLPDVKIYFNWSYIFIGTTFSLVSTLSATLIACRRALRTQAAELMRPKSPKPGKRVFLERFTSLWNAMSFGSIVTIRNMFRSKKRMIITTLGVAGCTMLILAAFGINNSIDTIINAQYGEGGISHYNLMAVLDDEQFPGQSETINDLEKDVRIKNAMLLDTKTMTASSSKEDNNTEMSIHLYVPESNKKLKECITLRSRKGHEPYNLTNEGAVITEKLALDTETEVGDNLILTAVDGKEYKVKVAAIVENYVYHYVYISPAYYHQVFGERPEFTYVLATLENYTNDNDEQNMADDLLSYTEVSGVVSTDVMVDSFNAIVDRLDVVVVIFIIAAGLLAFVILYNLTNISVQERLREIATIKVVGFTDAEVTSYVYRENIFLTLAGILIGLAGGVGLHRIVVEIAEVNVVMFGRDIYWWSYLLAVVLTVVFVALVSVLVHRRLQRFNVIEALKSVE